MAGALSTNIKQFAVKRPVLLLLLVFIVSILFRLPQLTRPLSKHFELNTAFVLISTDVWQKEGFNISGAAPAHNYRGEYNIPAGIYQGPFPRLITTGTYLSLGPGSYWLPYFVFRLFHVSASAGGIRILNLLLQFISIVLVYHLALVFCKQKTVALMAGILAVFCPVAMWFQGNAYCHEVAVIPMYLGLLLLLYRIWYAKNTGIIWYAGFGILLYAAVLTDWLAIFVCVAVTALQVRQKIKKGTWNIMLFLTMVLAAALGILTILYIYSNTVGWQELTNYIKATFLHRGIGGDMPSSSKNNLLNVAIYLLSGYGLVIPIAAAALFNKSTRQFFLQTHPVIIVAFIAPLLHYVLFYNFANEHDYAALKWMGLLPFVTAYTISRLSNRRPVAAGLLLLTCIVFNCVVFQWVNYPGTTTRKAEPYNWQEIAGYTIAKNTAPDEYIFTNQQQEFIPMNWYAKRETIAVADSSEARMLLTRLKGKKAAYIEITGFKITRIIHLAKP